MVSLVLVREGLRAPKLCSSPECICDMDLEVAYAVIFFLDRWCGSSWLSGLSPSEWGGVSLLVAFVLGVLVVAGDGLVVFFDAAPGEGAVSFLWVLSLLAVSSALGCCSGSWWRRLASLRPGPRSSLVWALADLALLVEFLAVSLGLPFFAAFSELRGALQVERFAACSFDIRRK